MKLLLASGILKVPTNDQIQADEKSMAALLAAAERYLLGGGKTDLEEWGTLLPCEQGALVTAQKKIDAERCAMTGLAGMSMEGALAVFSGADGGDARREMILQEALGKLVNRMKGLNFAVENK